MNDNNISWFVFFDYLTFVKKYDCNSLSTNIDELISQYPDEYKNCTEFLKSKGAA